MPLPHRAKAAGCCLHAALTDESLLHFCTVWCEGRCAKGKDRLITAVTFADVGVTLTYKYVVYIYTYIYAS